MAGPSGNPGAELPEWPEGERGVARAGGTGVSVPAGCQNGGSVSSSSQNPR